MLRLTRSLVLVSACLALVASCAPSKPPGSGRGVMLIAIDALRADHLGSAGYDRDTSPFLDSLAAEGVAFEQAFTTAPWVIPAHATLMTGCDPQVSMRILPDGVQKSVLTLWNVPDSAPRLAKEFLRNGYATGAFIDYPWLGSAQGFTPGFETFKAGEFGRTKREDYGVSGVGARLEQWIRNRPPGQDWFAYVHLHDLERIWQQTDPQWDTYFQPREELNSVPPVGDADHLFFAVPRHRWTGGLHTIGEYEAKYDGAIRRVDSALTRIFTRLRETEAFSNVTIVVVGTHGLGFGEAGMILDHGTLSDVDLHVPLIVRPAGSVEFTAGLRTTALASLMDVAPTLLDLAGLPIPAEMQGLSLVETLTGGESPRPYAFAHCGLQEGFAVMDPRWCFEQRKAWIARDEWLSFSWFGEARETGEAEEVLHDRQNDSTLAHWGSDRERPVIMERLRTAGEEWGARAEAAQHNMQSERWSEPVARDEPGTKPPARDGGAP